MDSAIVKLTLAPDSCAAIFALCIFVAPVAALRKIL